MTVDAFSLRDEIAALLPRLRRFGRQLTGHREDADDLVQLAIERALNRSAQWQAGTRLDSWLFRIMQNAWIDELRARRRQGEVLIVDDEAAAEVGSGASDAPLDAIAVRKAVALLSEEQRAVVALVLVEGLPYKEAAEALGIPIGTLTSRLARAREALQARLSPH
ncbi:RNA polymerase sigma factor [Ideonella sp. YS5]|uniref:RNA polymerase sigma factor n=1 Tax=Ideonella sp. YS5 TaxID=3453714 RepID=UPI003F719DEF